MSKVDISDDFCVETLVVSQVGVVGPIRELGKGHSGDVSVGDHTKDGGMD